MYERKYFFQKKKVYATLGFIPHDQDSLNSWTVEPNEMKNMIVKDSNWHD